MPRDVDEKRELAALTYGNAGREITQAFDVMNSNMALVAGTLAALLGALAAGELFGQALTTTNVPEFSSVSLLVLALAFPLTIRFFLRSVTAYQNLLRFNGVQKAAWRFLAGEVTWEAFAEHQRIYVHDWKSPKTLWVLIKENLKYGYFWVFVVATLPLLWAFKSTGCSRASLVGLLLIVAGLGWEGWTMKGTRRRYFTTPTEPELDRLNGLMERVPLESRGGQHGARGQRN
jgi:hypothetical protein